ncbi:sarcosine oxidase subunit delta [Arthrobacter castelli]|uniref:sarcosine oxidase subunit delta n=1 Tax=Arthrobacter castelli TaxID=271431 RepID=UPI00040300B0|nr:sarcosine oxidase subunit delta [Arthrobacter castelli]
MILIDCPHCGPRNEDEFTYGGQAHVPYPANPDELTDAEWAGFLFYRDNPLGEFAERWMHGLGCRRWFNAVRDTYSYKIITTYPMGWAAPQTQPQTQPDTKEVSA